MISEFPQAIMEPDKIQKLIITDGLKNGVETKESAASTATGTSIIACDLLMPNFAKM